MKNPKMFAILRVLVLFVLGFIGLSVALASISTADASGEQRNPQQRATATPTRKPTPRVPDDIPGGTGPGFGPVWIPIPERVGGTFGPVWDVADEVLAVMTAKAEELSRLQYSTESGLLQNEFQRDQTVQLNYAGFAPNQSVNVGLYRYDDQQETLTLVNQALIQTDSQGLSNAELPVPTNAPGGHYFLAACGLAVCNPESIFTQIDDSQVVWGSFNLSPRIDDLSIAVAPDVMNTTDMFNTIWKTEAPLKDEIVRIVVYREGELYTEQTINFANAVDRSLFLNPDGMGTQLYSPLPVFPGLSNIVPKLNQWIPGVSQVLRNQPIESGDYQMEVYVNEFLEATEEIRVEK